MWRGPFRVLLSAFISSSLLAFFFLGGGDFVGEEKYVAVVVFLTPHLILFLFGGPYLIAVGS